MCFTLQKSLISFFTFNSNFCNRTEEDQEVLYHFLTLYFSQQLWQLCFSSWNWTFERILKLWNDRSIGLLCSVARVVFTVAKGRSCRQVHNTTNQMTDERKERWQNKMLRRHLSSFFYGLRTAKYFELVFMVKLLS